MPELACTSSPTIFRPWSHKYKRSGSVTVVEGCRSGDVWVSEGNAIDNKGKIGRVFEMLNAKPKLSVLLLENVVVKTIDRELTPPLLSRVPRTLSLLPLYLRTQKSLEGRNRRLRPTTLALTMGHYALPVL
jgi:hypothetical protein